jgi:N-acetylglucosaminyldiphosphoundecaprenol N-acetyl-beta-D-mannosaminyltransferase
MRESKQVANFLGIGVEAITYDELVEKVDGWIKDKSGRSHHIACINAYCIALARKDERLAKIYNGADIAGPDGMPFVRWIRYVHGVNCDRIAAPDTILELAKRSKEKKYTFYLYGGHPEVLRRMRKFLENKFPHIKIVGHYSPPFRQLTKEEDSSICAEINRLNPDIICVGLGTPKQDYWIDEHLNSIQGAVIIASGATFDFFGGRIKMAPEWLRRSGFEWLYRLCSKDFFRLWKRYVIYNGIFLFSFLLQKTKVKKYEVMKWQRT